MHAIHLLLLTHVQVHGIASWFDAYFQGSDSTLVLSTAPQSAPTHWYQV